MNKVTIITPYINNLEYKQPISISEQVKIIQEEDIDKIGSDLMYEKLWLKCAPSDIFILHADMIPYSKNWLKDILLYVNRYPEAGMFGCKLWYPREHGLPSNIIQSAGGKFENNIPTHFGSGLEMYSKKAWKDLEFDTGQYDCIREVAWTTFGGVYIRRQVLDQVGIFNREYNWSYNRDVDYCLQARKLGWKIYQIPIPIYHFESRDNKLLRNKDKKLNKIELQNLQILQNKWKDTKYYKTIERIINDR